MINDGAGRHTRAILTVAQIRGLTRAMQPVSSRSKPLEAGDAYLRGEELLASSVSVDKTVMQRLDVAGVPGLLAMLPEHPRHVVVLCYGLCGGCVHRWREIADRLSRSGRRARELEPGAINILRPLSIRLLAE